MGNVNTNQLNAVKNVLDYGEAVDFYKALNECGHVQRLSAIIHVLRHELGMKIVDYKLNNVNVYQLYDYAPDYIKEKWSFFRDFTPADVMAYDFTRKPTRNAFDTILEEDEKER